MKFLRYILFPFSIVYDMVTRIRNFCFDVGIFKETSFKIPVLVVGNLSVGGTGKTPQIEYLIRLLKDTYKTAVLSRGYGRNTKGFIEVDETHTAKEVGDEPLQYFKKYSEIDVAVDENRVEGITRLMQEKSPEIVLLDDAFQHRKVKGSCYILLTKYDDLFIDDFLLPTGNLRESRKGAKRAAVIVVTKCPENIKKTDKERIKNRLAKYQKKVFFTTISYDKRTLGSQIISVEDLTDYEVVLVTGIANPKPLLTFLSEQKVNYKHIKFPDHHQFSSKEITAIKSEFDGLLSTKKMILTTEKDYVRLSNSINNLSYLGIRTSFLFDEAQEFNQFINSHVKQNQR